MDSRVSWNTQPERNNLTLVLLVGRIQAFTAPSKEVLEVGDGLIGHVDIRVVSWLVVAGDGWE